MANNTYSSGGPVPKERLSTADLADAGRGESDSSRATGGAPTEVARVSRPDEQAGDANAAFKTTTERVEASTQRQNTPAATAAVMAKEPDSGPLFSAEEASKLRAQWDSIQVGFVDEPRKAVEEADGLVATAMKRLAEQFADERSRLEGQWDCGGDVSTEDLRLALRRYRSFFGRLLTV